jgi:hypothetical protein
MSQKKETKQRGTKGRAIEMKQKKGEKVIKTESQKRQKKGE